MVPRLHDPSIPLNCPYCGLPTTHEHTEGETHVYLCPRHGTLLLPSDGRLRRAELLDPEERDRRIGRDAVEALNQAAIDARTSPFRHRLQRAVLEHALRMPDSHVKTMIEATLWPEYRLEYDQRRKASEDAIREAFNVFEPKDTDPRH